MTTLVILGNGFDLDLGLKTSYKDFMYSDECQRLVKNRNNYLINRIYNNLKLQNWIDVESELKSFAREFNDCSADFYNRINIEYKQLTDALHCYLNRIQHEAKAEEPDCLLANSHAGKLLKIICESPDDYEIISFNYTDLNELAHKLKMLPDDKQLSVFNVHGTLSHKNIILGFEDSAENIDTFSFMIKTFNNHYSGRSFRKKLSEHKEIILFGLSMGKIDYPYFSKFFKELSSEDLPAEKSVRLFIITANEDSKLQIFKQLRVMNDNRTDILFDQNEINTICTQDYNSQVRFHHYMMGIKARHVAEKIFGFRQVDVKI